MYDRAKAFGLSPLTYNATEIITEDIGDHWIQLESFTTKMNIKHVQDFKKEVNFDVNKVLITGEPAYVAQILDEFKAPYEGKMSIYRSDPYFIECMANGIDKAASLDVLCKKLGIKQEETIAFGDGYNDLSLIEYCGYGVAMENAVDEVKERANYITLSIDDLHKGIIYGYYQEEKLIGFTILCIHHQIVSILYLAVKEEYRNLGYGSMILEDLSKEYVSNRIMLDIEQIKECKNKEQRIKRKQFYLRNGFQETKVCYTWQKEDYIILCKNGMIGDKEFWSFWNSLKRRQDEINRAKA